jgi:hypothetical protein
MKPEERAVLRALGAQRAAHLRAAKRLQDARDALAAALGCTHPREALVSYQWEHDNGYGRQHMCTGTRCRICNYECSFPGPYAKLPVV